jgi:hypothetical protein
MDEDPTNPTQEKSKRLFPYWLRYPKQSSARKMRNLPINYVPQRQMQQINYGQNASAGNAMGRIKPLKPNILDRQQEVQEQERKKMQDKSGVKWVKVLDR